MSEIETETIPSGSPEDAPSSGRGDPRAPRNPRNPRNPDGWNVGEEGYLSLLVGPGGVLEKLARGATLSEVLAALIGIVERQCPDIVGSVLVRHPTEDRFELAVAPSLSPRYAQALAQAPITPPYPSPCAQAAHQGMAVSAADIAAEDRWGDAWKQLARSNGLATCYSNPIFAPDGSPVGSFDFYAREVGHDPKRNDVCLVETVTHLAGIAIDRDRLERARRAACQGADSQRRLYEAILSNTPDLAYIWNLKHRFIYVNEGLLKMWGKTWEEAIGKNCLELGYEPWHAAMHDREIEQVIATKQPVRGEVPFTGPLGRRIYDYLLVPVLGADGRVEAVAGTTRDVTERRQTLEELAQAKEHLLAELTDARILQDVSRALLEEGATEVLYGKILDAAVRMMHAQYGSMQMLAASSSAGEDPRRLALLAHRGFDDHAERFWKQVGLSSKSICVEALRRETRVLATDVRACEFLSDSADLAIYLQAGIYAVQSTPLISRSGQVLGMISTHWNRPHQPTERELRLLDILARQAADLLERREAERERGHLAAIVQSSGDAIISKDLNGIIQTWNDGAAELFGYTAQEAVGRSITMLIPPDHIDEEPYILDRIRHGERVDHYETVRQRKDGSRVHISLTVSPIYDSRGVIIGASKIARDITEQIEARRQREQAHQAAKAANRAKDRFLAMLSHELRTPLSPVLMTVSARAEDSSLPRDLREDMLMIRRNIELETRLIDDLLDLSRVANGKLQLRKERVSVRGIFSQAGQNCVADAIQKHIDVRWDLTMDKDEVMADPARLQQVFWNLLRNAIKFTPSGGWVEVRSQILGNRTLRVEFQDNGVGMAPELLPQVFDAFEQGDVREVRDTRPGGGLGLGLAICRTIVQMHKGVIRAASPGRGRGATFTVELPLAKPASPADRAVSPAPERPAPSPSIHQPPRRILLVEDHADTLRILARLLRRQGYEVETADSAAEALKQAESHQFHLVISDIGLPDATGYDLMKQIRSRHGIKGIALSGYGMDRDIVRSHEAGFSDHLVKPIKLAQLEQSVRQVLEMENG